jgi:putative ABC transport system permease protein
MTHRRVVSGTERWFRLLLRLYPPDFREEMGDAVVEAYRDRARQARTARGPAAVLAVCAVALWDSLRSGLGERLRPAVAWRRTGDWGRDIELVTRRLRRAPAFVIATVATLTIGLGMFAVVYGAVHKILLAPLPYRDADDLYYVWRDYGSILDLKRGLLSGPDVIELQKAAAAGAASGVIQDAVGLQRCECGTFALSEGSETMEIAVTMTSPNLFSLLGATPAIGRGFAPDEVGPGRSRVIVLSHELWSRLGADSAIVGSEVRLSGRPHIIIGVLSPKFGFARHDWQGPAPPVDAYTPFDFNLAERPPGNGSHSGLIRARRGASPREVAAAVESVGRIIDTRDFSGRGLRLYPVGLKPDLVARVRPALVVLGAAGALLALMLMVNLSSVLLARAAQRELEFAVSRALGANGVAIVRATLLEGGILGVAGGALGALAAVWGLRGLVSIAPMDLPRREAIAMDGTIATTVIAIGALLGVLAAAVPAVWTARSALPRLLASSGVRGGGGHGRLRRALVVTQVALSLVLLCSGGLVVRSFEYLLRSEPGFRPEGVLTVFVRTPPQFFPRPEDVAAFQERIQNALAEIPGVTGASAASSLPLTAVTAQGIITIPGAPGNVGDPERDAVLTDIMGARAGYFEVMGMRLLAGRTFETARRPGVRDAVIDHTFARRFFGGVSPLGVRFPYGRDSLTIVGVVGQPRLYDVHRDGPPQIFVRVEDWSFRPLYYVVRTGERDPLVLLPDVRAAVRRIEPRVAAGNPRSMQGIIDDTLRQQRTSATLITAFAIGALLLAAMGLFGVVAGSVTRRRHELAVRMALGADHGRVLRLVLREGAVLVSAGVLIGVPGVLAAGQLIRGMLVGVSPWDPVTLFAVALGLGLVTMGTCYLPARRVLGIEPAGLLREE